MKGKLLKSSLIAAGALVLSTLGIFASDGIRGIDHNIANIAGVGQASACKTGTVPMKFKGNTLCVDVYEASAGSGCPNANPSSIVQSEQNTNIHNCYAASVKGVKPWTSISLPQAQRMCAGAGKRLPTSDEWYAIALGTDPSKCVVNESDSKPTGFSECISSIKAYDLVGNVWEWVNENVVGNTYQNRQLPEEGYVASVDASGVAITSDKSSQQLYGDDYFWSAKDGVFGMIRGGFYGSKDDAGLYAINASVPTSFASPGVGFRCVEDVI